MRTAATPIGHQHNPMITMTTGMKAGVDPLARE
jgi:hypothetical protein